MTPDHPIRRARGLAVFIMLAVFLSGPLASQVWAAGKLEPKWRSIVGTAECLAFYKGAFDVRPVTDGRLRVPTFDLSSFANRGNDVFAPWTHVAGTGKHIFFYDRPSKQSRADPVNAGCQLASDTVEQSGYGDWTHVVGVGDDLLFFYNKDTGAWASGRLDGIGAFSSLASGTVPKEWTHIVVAGNRVFFYNADATGTSTNAMTGVLDGAGGFIPKQNYGFATNWTHVAGTRNGGLVFYDSASGEGMTGRLDAEAKWVLFDGDVTFGRGWTRVAGGGTRSLLFYDHKTGKAAGGYLTAKCEWRRTVGYTG